MRHLDQDLKTFVEKELNNVCDNIDFDPTENIPRRAEKNIERFLKDSKGNLVVNEKVHIIMHQFRRKAKRRGFNKFLILGAFGHGKSMISGTYVLMYDLTRKKVEDIKVGDLLMGPDSKPRKVLAIGSGKEQSYKIILKNKDSFKCNESHKMPFYISNRWNGYHKGDIYIGTIKEYLNIPEWARKNCWKIQKAKLNFSYQKVFMNPYVYGVWLGDGHCSGIKFTINDNDLIIADYLWNWAEQNKLQMRIIEFIR